MFFISQGDLGNLTYSSSNETQRKILPDLKKKKKKRSAKQSFFLAATTPDPLQDPFLGSLLNTDGKASNMLD